MSPMIHKGMSLGLVVVLCVSAGWPAVILASPPNSAIVTEALQSHPRLRDPGDLEARIDSLLESSMDALHIPGMVISIVMDGGVLLSKGYGLADLASNRPMDPDVTVVRPGSISKLFTVTAVMQLVEQGRLGLDDDVNEHLDAFQLEETFPEPVRVRHLLTHTGGFDDRMIGQQARSLEEILPLGTYLAERMPPRVMPPGEFSCYSNNGMALAGYLVEAISGQPYEQYVRKHILDSLQMRSTHYRPRLGPTSQWATSYAYADGKYTAQPYIHIHGGPGGAWDATAADMARFMIAHLQLGRYGETRILQEPTARAMQRRQFTHDPRLHGIGFGFFLGETRGRRLAKHGGGHLGFYASLTLVPDESLGVFYACNQVSMSSSMRVRRLRKALVDALLDRLYPAEQVASPPPLLGLGRSVEPLAGSYRHNRLTRGSLLRLPMDLLSQLEVEAAGDTLLLGSLWQETTRWIETDTLLFQQIDGFAAGRTMAFRTDESGRATHMFHEGAEALDRVPWWEGTPAQMVLLALLVVFLVAPCLVWPTGYAIRRLRGQITSGGRPSRLARRLAATTCALGLLFVVGYVLTLSLRLFDLFIEVPAGTVALLALPLLLCLLAIGMVVCSVLAWRHGYWGLLGRLHYSATTLAVIAFALFLAHWNLLDFRY